jgi:hypothetical protein
MRAGFPSGIPRAAPAPTPIIAPGAPPMVVVAELTQSAGANINPVVAAGPGAGSSCER